MDSTIDIEPRDASQNADADSEVRATRYRAIFQSAVDFAMIASGRDGRILEWNSGAEIIFGWSVEEMLGQPADRVFTAEDQAQDAAALEMRRALETGRAIDERWHLKKDGSRFWASGEMMPLRDEVGTHLGFIKIARDRTEARLTQEAQRADTDFLRSVLASSGDCIKVLDLDGKLVFMSEVGQRVMEVDDFNAIRGCPWSDLWEGEGKTSAKAAMEAAKGGGLGHFQGPANTVAGTPRWWDVQVTSIPGADGRPEKLLTVSRDITLTRLAEEALLEAQGLNTLILNSSSDCIVVLDLEGHTQYVSRGGIESMEVSDVEAILGLSWLRVWKGADHDAARHAVAQARAGGVGRFQGFCPTHRGTPKWWDVLISSLPGRDGTPERLVSIGRDITELKQAAQQLARSEERLTLALDTSSMIGIWDWDVAGDIVYADANVARMFALDPTQAQAGMPIAKYIDGIHPEDRDRVGAAIKVAVETGDPYSCEFRLTASVGRVAHVFTRGRCHRDADGKPERFPGITLDITERKQAEQRQAGLLELGDRLRDGGESDEIVAFSAALIGRTLGASRAGYGSCDESGTFVQFERDWNDGVTSISGFYEVQDYGSFGELLRRGEVLIVDDVRTDSRMAAGKFEALSIRALVNIPVMEDGRMAGLFFVHDKAPRVWTNEQTDFIRGVADRTWAAVEQSRAAQALKESQARLKQLNETLELEVEQRTRERDRAWKYSLDLQLVVSADGIIRAANQAWTAILGWQPEEVVDRHHLSFSHPDDRVSSDDALSVTSQTALNAYEHRALHKDGSYRWISWVAASAGDLIYASGRHITAEKEAAAALEAMQEQLRQSQKMEAVGQLTGGLAHDFNNLLTGITGSLEVLEMRVAQGRFTELDRYVGAAQGAARRAAALTHRLLAFSRRQTLDPKAINVNRLIGEMEELIRRTVGPAIHTEVVGAAGLWTTLIDPNQLESALLNLCINARDAMPDGGRLTIETANQWLDPRAGSEHDLPPGPYLSLCVTDTGTGMTPEVIGRAFDPFFTTKPLGMGTGLGLSMVYGFARQSGGHVHIDSGMGHGTTLCLYLPRHHGEAESAEVVGRLEVARAEQGQVILVVDDEPTVRMLVTEVLEELGYMALEAADGASGLKVLQSVARVDLLVTDVGLPGGLNGRQLADAARVLRPRLKVLFITGYAESAVVGNGHFEPGMQVLSKPFTMDALGIRIKHLIAQT